MWKWDSTFCCSLIMASHKSKAKAVTPDEQYCLIIPVKKSCFAVVCGILIVGGLAGCSMAAAQSGGAPAAPGISAQKPGESGGLAESQASQETTTILAVAEWDENGQKESAYEERFQPYEKFGLVYHADKTSWNITASQCAGLRTITLSRTKDNRWAWISSTKTAWWTSMRFVT